MSAPDVAHAVLEIQETRAEVDRLRKINRRLFEGTGRLIHQIRNLQGFNNHLLDLVNALSVDLEDEALLLMVKRAMEEKP